jgi:O-antigen ligase
MARQIGLNPFGAFLLLLMIGLLCAAASMISGLGINQGLLIGLGMAIAILVFLQTRLALYLLIVSMLLSPEFGVAGLATSAASLGRGVTFRTDDFLLVVLGISWFIKSALYKELGVFKKTPLNGAILFYVAACTISTLIGMGEGRVELLTGTLFLVKYSQYFVIFLMVINNIDDDKQLRRYWLAVVLTAVIVGAVGLAQVPGGDRVTAPFEGDDPEPNTFAGYLGFIILICAALGLVLTEYRKRILYFAIASYLFVPFLFTLSRAGYLGFIPGMAVVLFLTRNRILSYILVAFALTLLIAPGLFPRVVRERIAFTWSQEPTRGQIMVLGQRLDTSTSARLGSFKQVLEEFPQKPLFGYGVTGWRFVDSQYFRTLIETGSVGLVALLFLYFRLFQLGLDRLRYFTDDPFYRGLSIGFLGGFVCLLFHAVGSNTFIIVRIMEPFWLVTGFVFISPFVYSGRFLEERAETRTVAA